VTTYLAAAEALLLVLQQGVRVFSPQAAGFTGWLDAVGAACVFCLFLLGLRWFRQVVMWRLRNRLIVTYVFIGVIPVALLISMGIIGGYLFAGQFATFVISSDLTTQLKSLEAINRTAVRGIAAQLERGAPLGQATGAVLLESPPRSMTVWKVSSAPAVQKEGPRRNEQAVAFVLPAGSPVVSPPPDLPGKNFSAIIGDENGVYLRAWTTVPAGSKQLIAITSEPLDQARLARIAAGIGEVTLHLPSFVRPPAPAAMPNDGASTGGKMMSSQAPADSKARNPKGATVKGKPEKATVLRAPESGEVVEVGPAISAGNLAAARGRWDREVQFAIPFTVWGWHSGKSTTAIVGVHTRLSSLDDRLFAALGAYTSSIFIALVAIGFFFALIEVAALIIGIRLTRTMTRSVAELYRATEHINRGDLKHRIQVTSRDQLAALETSFNSMTESLQNLFAEHQEKQRMESELAIAQEVQAQLFPQEPAQLASLEVFGICRPARTVSGDYYDFLARGDDKLAIAVGDISGKGISAALLMATIHSAIRVYEFGRLPSRITVGATAMAAAEDCEAAAGALQSPATVLQLLNHHLYRSTPPEKYATLFLGLWDGAQHRLCYSNGGHLPPLVIGKDGNVRKLDCGGTVIGLFEEMKWDEDGVDLSPGDLFLAYSDGITEPENEFGEFGEQRLLDLVLENRDLPLARISELVIAAVMDWIGAGEQPDDITLVLARAK
jgi:sigma-B regulation protein RsbU (phosphoserine phosphatase)